MGKILRKYKYTIIAITLISIIAIASTRIISAFLSDADTVDNNITIGGCNIKLVENFEPPKELKPGISFTKDVKVKNLGPSNCFVRIKAVFTDSDMEKYCDVDFNTTDYDYNSEDNFYYYKHILKSGETTPSLFTTVSIQNDAPEAEMKDFDILVYTESYQSTGFTEYADAWAYFKRNKPNT